MSSGARLAQAVIDAADALAAWEPDGWGDLFATMAALPDVLGAAGEAVTVAAVAAEDARVIKPWVTSAAQEAGDWTQRAAAGLGAMYRPDPWLRTSGPRWLPPGGTS